MKVAIDAIKENPINPRDISPDKLEKLVRSIEVFPQMLDLRPIVVDETMTILGGNMRYRAMKILEMSEVMIIVAEGLSEDQKKEFLIKDNASFGEWNWERLLFNFEKEKVELWGIDVPKVNFSRPNAIKENFSINEGKIETDIVVGDLIEIGHHRLMCGDSTNTEHVIKLMNGETAEILFTSPPYSDMREYNGDKDVSITKIVEFIPTWKPFVNFQCVNLGIQRKDNDIISYWDEYINRARLCGYKLMAWNVWHKSNVSIGQQSAFIPIYHEWIFVFGTKFKDINRTVNRKSKIKTNNVRLSRQADGSTKQSTIGEQHDYKEMESVFYSASESGTIRQLHPATFPVELPTEYILAMTNENEIVAESFGGSGTTMVASHATKRKCFAMELDPIYCQVIIQRMKKLDPNIIVKKNGDVI